ncbi:MAG: Ribulose-phosphate 3-epimerase [Chlamydiae bacterium]|nr:Ribulose-phosphate 3-epimerase [Chlamydiota bacterium]
MTKNPFPPIIEPSLLSSDFGKLADEAKRAEDAGADALHLDVMDGHFVRNFALSPKAVAAINRATDLFLDVHIMIYNPFDYIERFVEAGADRITFHIEATEDVEETLAYIRHCNVEAGLAFCPDTSESVIPKYLDKCDLMLMMTVNPGFGGQAFLPQVLEKIRFTRDICDKLGLRKQGKVPEGGVDPQTVAPFDIQVDGGIDDKTAKQCHDAGANVFVSGSYLFSTSDMKKAIQNMKEFR